VAYIGVLADLTEGNLPWLKFIGWIAIANLLACLVSYPFGKITDDRR
jgi:hypothetical protein